jgi:hypothetical protein
MQMADNSAPAAGTRPEAELLLCCARTRLDPESAGRIRTLVREPIDWHYLTRAASTHGVMPLLYWHLNAVCPEAVPGAILEQLRRHFHVNTFHNQFLTRELLKLLRLFGAHGIPAVPYKGPALAAAAYGDLAFRQFGDLDILIYKQDLLRAKDLLTAQGYQLELSDEEEATFLRDRYHYHFVRDAGRLHVEIHWAFTRRYWSFPVDPKRLWERLEPVPLAGATVLSFHPEDLLLILCVHGAKHYWERLAWICDVAELVRVHQGMDWGRVMEQAVRLRSARILSLGLLLARDLVGATLPEKVLRGIQADPVVASLVTQVRGHLFSEAEGEHPHPHGFYPRLRERLPDRMRHLRYYYLHQLLPQAITPNAKDRAFLALPASLSFLYYLLRPIRLAKEYGLSRLKR